MARETVLVVDDEQDILKLVEYNLTKNGYRAICVPSGEDALKAARLNTPDLVLLNLMLPGMFRGHVPGTSYATLDTGRSA